MPKRNFKFRNPNFLASIQEDILMARNPNFGFRIRKARKLGLACESFYLNLGCPMFDTLHLSNVGNAFQWYVDICENIRGMGFLAECE